MRDLVLALTLTVVFVLPPSVSGQADAGALASLVKNLKHKDDKERIKAMRALAKLGAKAKPAAHALCEAAARETKPELKSEARAALAKVRPDLAPHVVALLDGTNPSAPIDAAKAIGKMGPDEGAAGTWALRFGVYRCDRGKFDDPVPVAAACLAALGEVKSADADATHEVGQAATLNKSATVRETAVQALGKIAAAQAERRRDAVRYVQLALRDREVAVRVAALEAAGTLGPDAKTLLRAIQAAAKDESEEVRSAANKAATAIEGK